MSYLDYEKVTLWEDVMIKKRLENIDNNSILDLYDRLKVETDGQVKSNRGGWQLDLFRWEHTEVIPLFSEIENFCTQFFYEKYDINRGLRLNRAWLNANQRGHYNSAHTHPGAFWSGVYYVKADENPDQGIISFLRSDHGAVLTYGTVYAEGTTRARDPMMRECYQYVPKTGDLIMFPPYIMHEVFRNETDSERVVIAFNMQLDNDNMDMKVQHSIV